MREIVIDTETTGLNHKVGDRIIEVACVELVNHVSTNNHLQFYCSTNRTITEEAARVHGLSNSFLSKFPTFRENAQNLYINTSHEYPVNPSVQPSNIVKKWGDFKRDSLDLNLLGKYRKDAIKIFDKTGWK